MLDIDLLRKEFEIIKIQELATLKNLLFNYKDYNPYQCIHPRLGIHVICDNIYLKMLPFGMTATELLNKIKELYNYPLTVDLKFIHSSFFTEKHLPIIGGHNDSSSSKTVYF